MFGFLIEKQQHQDVVVSVMCLFLAVPWIGLLCVIVVFPGYTHFHLFQMIKSWFHQRGFTTFVNCLWGFTIFVKAWLRLDTDVRGQV